jgi:hypothetical protein
MSWSTSFVVVEGRGVADVIAAIGLVPHGTDMASAEDVLSGRDLPFAAETALAEIEGWCVIADSCGAIFSDIEGRGEIDILSRGTRAAGFLIGGSTGTCALRLCVDGIEQRFVIHEAGTIVEERGAPLPEEANIPMPRWGYDDDWILTVLERLTGLTWATIEPYEFLLASPLPASLPDHSGATRLGFWAGLRRQEGYSN